MPELRQKAGQQNYRQTLQLGLEEDEEADELGEGADEGEGDRDFEGAESEGDHPNDEDEFEANISVNNEGSRRRRKAREGTPSRELPQRSARALQPAESYQVSSAVRLPVGMERKSVVKERLDARRSWTRSTAWAGRRPTKREAQGGQGGKGSGRSGASTSCGRSGTKVSQWRLIRAGKGKGKGKGRSGRRASRWRSESREKLRR